MAPYTLSRPAGPIVDGESIGVSPGEAPPPSEKDGCALPREAHYIRVYTPKVGNWGETISVADAGPCQEK